MLFPFTIISRPVSNYLEDKVTLRRLSAPLLYAYDACTFFRRLRGLHGVPPLGPTDALIIRPCWIIHTFGLKQRIDVIFMNRYGVILKQSRVAPRRIAFCWQASVVVEMAEGTASRINLGVGQTFEPSSGEWQ